MRYVDILKISDEKRNISLAGMTGELFSIYVSNLVKDDNVVIVTSTLYEANKLHSSISNYTDT